MPLRKINKHIEIVSSSNKFLSSMSEKSRDAIQTSLAKSYRKVGVTLVDNEADLDALIGMKPDIVFLGMACVPRKPTATNSHPQIWIADELHKNNIPYTGSSAAAMDLEKDKLKAKKVIKKAGLSTAPFFMAYTGQFTSESQLVLDFPMFIKPPKLGSGIGVDDKSVVRNYREYKTKIAALDKELGSESLVETYLTGREFKVAILKNSKDDDYLIVPLEMVSNANNKGDVFLGQKIKASSETSTQTIVVTDKDKKQELSILAVDCFHALGAEGYGTIDIRCDEQGVAYFLEANLIPSTIEDESTFQKAMSLSYDDMMKRIIELGFNSFTPYVAPLPPEPKPELTTAK